MRRTRASRVLAVLMALWFAVAANQPQLYGACPMSVAHGGMHASAPVNGGMAMPMPMGGAAHEMSAPDGSAPNHAPAPLPPDCCSCIAACCGSAALPPAQLAATIDISLVAQPLRHGTGAMRAAGAVDLMLPFANGPPAYLAV